MNIDEILQSAEHAETIDRLKRGRGTRPPNSAEAFDQLDPRRHKIVTDKIAYPDKQVATDDGQGGTRTETVKINRISLAIQEQIVRRSVAFLFGNPVSYTASPEEGSLEEALLIAIRAVLRDVRSGALDRRIGRAVCSFRECAELWYAIERPQSVYGFPSSVKLRVRLLSPEWGDELFPYFDEADDMVAFSRAFMQEEIGADGKAEEIEYFETYTDHLHVLWRKGKGGYEYAEGYPRANPLGKIPVVYSRQAKTEWQDVQAMIERLEVLLSKFADTNDYHASPKIIITGRVEGFLRKGESGGILEAEHGADAKYLSWQSAPESVKLEIETLLRNIYSITQTPDLSFDAVKGLGAMSGVALKLLFMDAHLKVQDKREIFDEHLQRRVSIVKAFLSVMHPPFASVADNLQVEAEITPYMISNEAEDLQYWLSANGGKPLISQLESMRAMALTSDPARDFERLQEEMGAESFSDTEPRNY